MKKGDYVKWINSTQSEYVTEGKVYKIATLDGDWLRVKNDSGKIMGWQHCNFEPVKVAVHCKTETEWNRVCENHSCTADFGGVSGVSNECEEVGLRVDVQTGGWGSLGYFKSNGFHIISAHEYLGEDPTHSLAGLDVRVGNGRIDLQWGLTESQLAKLGAEPLQTNNIKGEDKMNKNIVAVFEKTEEAVMVEGYLTDAIKERIFMEKNKPAILKACKEAKEAAENKD